MDLPMIDNKPRVLEPETDDEFSNLMVGSSMALGERQLPKRDRVQAYLPRQ